MSGMRLAFPLTPATAGKLALSPEGRGEKHQDQVKEI